jgi:predicted metal-dependent hydrolase
MASGACERQRGRRCTGRRGVNAPQKVMLSSSTVGAFYGKAMAIPDLGERIVFLNRGQGWVVRKLREMLPRVRDNQLHADVSEMLRSHEAKIVLAGELSGRAL